MLLNFLQNHWTVECWEESSWYWAIESLKVLSWDDSTECLDMSSLKLTMENGKCHPTTAEGWDKIRLKLCSFVSMFCSCAPACNPVCRSGQAKIINIICFMKSDYFTHQKVLVLIVMKNKENANTIEHDGRFSSVWKIGAFVALVDQLFHRHAVLRSPLKILQDHGISVPLTWHSGVEILWYLYDWRL